MLQAGQQLNRYRIIRLLGSGGMGDVYLAEDTPINRQVAVKVVRVEAVGGAGGGDTEAQETVRLFLREARAIAMLDHPHILPLFDYGQGQIDGQELVYLVMPYRPEGSLSTWLRQRNSAGLSRIAPQEVARLIGQAASALQHAHERQVIHQDVKPANFLIRQQNTVQPDLLLTDFGIARLSSGTSNVSQAVRGTPSYMAPEQWQSKPVPATDQYALAIMAYELLAGRTPFQGAPSQIMYQHLINPPSPPSQLNSSLPGGVDAVLLRALSKAPEDRYPSILAFSDELARAVGVTGAGSRDSSGSINAGAGSAPRMQATLLISQQEAVQGSERTITLPGGRRVNVRIPAGTHNGQVIYPEGAEVSLAIMVSSGETPASAGPSSGQYDGTYVTPQHPAGPVTPPQGPLSGSGLAGIAPSSPGPLVPPPPPPAQGQYGMPAATGYGTPAAPPSYAGYAQSQPNPSPYNFSGGHTGYGGSPADPTVQGNLPASYGAYGSVPSPPPQMVPPPGGYAPGSAGAQKSSPALRIVVIALAVVLVLSSAVIGVVLFQNRGGGGGNLLTSSADLTATARAQATNQANATSTANVRNQQATAAAQATVSAQATAAVIAANPYPTYMPGGGTLTLFDDLKTSVHWQEFEDKKWGGACHFQDGALHAVQTTVARNYLCYETGVFSDIAMEAEMTIQQGDCGGLIFRYDPSKGPAYIYFVCQTGSVYLYKYSDFNTSKDIMPAIYNAPSVKKGLGSMNRLGVLVNGNTIKLYCNGQLVNTVTDGGLTQGQLGMVTSSISKMTDVKYNNVKVWKV